MDRQRSRLGVEYLAEGAGERRLSDATAEIGVREEDRFARAVHLELLLGHADARTERDAVWRLSDPHHLDVAGNAQLPLKIVSSGREELRGRLVDG